ncbi:PilZ domain-containing protein [Treponema sp.]|uniref:PilZ domain-containing protein n=1 Tax=Treponema sp. TaxID=166 RepID=UPI00388E27A5
MNTGSLLDARGMSFLYIFIAVVVVGLVLAAIVALFIYRFIARTHTKEWLEAQKNRETKLKDVDYVAKEANLTQSEKIRLWHICRRYKAKNIRYLYRSVNELNDMFREEYVRMTTKQARNDEKIGVFFSLRFKLENAHNRKLTASSTRGIKAEQSITFYDRNNSPWELKVIKRIDSGFYIELPELVNVEGKKPNPLDRVKITFTFPSGQAFNAITRAIRYERFPNSDKEYLLLANSNHIKPVVRRGAKRMSMDESITFSAIKNVGTKENPILEVQQKKYPGNMMDISATGCKIFCNLPITKGQMLDIQFHLPEKTTEHEAQGKIVATKVMPDKKTFVLHVQFINIEQYVKNEIYSVIYGYS